MSYDKYDKFNMLIGLR